MLKKGFEKISELPIVIFEDYPHLIELYEFTWGLANNHISHKEGLPSTHFMDEGFEDDKVWVWDTCFMALFCRYANDLFPGIESLDNFYARQRDDGYISMCHILETGEDAYPVGTIGRINPPLLAWVEWEYYLSTGNKERLKRILPHLERLDSWIEKNRRREDGSYWFVDCGSSGMDNSPRTPRTNDAGADTSFVDLASQQALSALCVARIADAVENTEVSEQFHKFHQERKEYVNNELWNDRHGFYLDAHISFHGCVKNFVNSKTAASFWPMIAEIPSSEQIDSLVDYLKDPRHFNRPNAVPTLSFDDCNYKDDGGYWLGGVWAPTNFMIVKGLVAQGQHELAREISLNYIEMLYRVWKSVEPNTLWECYSPETDAPATAPAGDLCRPDFVGWTGLGPISMFIENVLGLEVDYPNRKITWRTEATCEHGIRNLLFGPHKISLIAKNRKSPDVMPELTIESDCSFQLIFISGDLKEVVE